MTLFVCLLITAVAIYYVFGVPRTISAGPEQTRINFLRERKEAAYENIRDLNFEYKAGKLPDADYQNMKATLEQEAAALLAEIERLEAADNSAIGERKL